MIEINHPTKAGKSLSVLGNGKFPNGPRALGANADAVW